MTENTETTPGTADAVAGALVDEDGNVVAEAGVAVEGSQALLVARFADPDTAAAAYDALRDAESQQRIDIQGVLVVDADAEGKIKVRKLTDHHTRNGMLFGAVAGAALAIIFPPSLLAGAALGGVVGAAVGKVGNVATKSDIAKELAEVITPGTFGIVAVVDVAALDAVKAAIPAADEVKTVQVDDQTASAVTEAAGAAAGATKGA